MNDKVFKFTKIWPSIQNVIRVPHNDEEYNNLVIFLDDIIDEIGENETHKLASLAEILGILISHYEAQYDFELTEKPIDILKTLMDEHGLNQSEMKEIGSQGVVSEILAGKRSLNSRQIKALSDKFGVSPAVFI